MESKKTKIVLIIILSLIFVYSSVRLGMIIYDYHIENVMNDGIRDGVLTERGDFIIHLPDEQEEDYMRKEGLPFINFDALSNIGPEIIGWILIPNTNVSYPLVQGKDNDKYLDTGPDGRYSGGGSIFMDSRNSADLSDQNTIIYGHYRKSGSMFGTLLNYKKAEYLEANPYVYIIMKDTTYKYQIFSTYAVYETGDNYQMQFSSQSEFEKHLKRIKGRSNLENEFEPDPSSNIIELSTCTADNAGRYLVFASLVEQTDTLKEQDIEKIEE